MDIGTLFQIEALGDNQIKITRSEYLKSLSLDEQVKVLTSYLDILKEQKSTDEDIGLTEEELNMQIMITQGLLAQLEKVSEKDLP
jgi:hypothetical protein